MKINRHKNPGDTDFVILEAVAPGVQICVEFQADSGMQLLCPTHFVIILRIWMHIAHSLAWINGVMPDEAGQQRIFEWWRREVAVVGGMQHGFCLIEVIRQPNARAGLHARINQIEIVITQAQINREVAHRREVILHISARLAAKKTSAERRKHVWIAAAIKKETLVFAQPHQIDASFKEMAMPVMRKITLDSQRQRRARGSGKWRDRVSCGEHTV